VPDAGEGSASRPLGKEPLVLVGKEVGGGGGNARTHYKNMSGFRNFVLKKKKKRTEGDG
jgi:hypothetical protein